MTLRIAATAMLAVALLGGCGNSDEQWQTGSQTPTPTQVRAAATPGQASTSGAVWEEYISEEGGWIALLPGEPEAETLEMETEAGSTVQATYDRVEIGDMTYTIMYVDLPPESLTLSEDEFFSQYIANFVAKVESDAGADLPEPEVRTITLDGQYPGREFTFGVEDFLSRARTYLVEDRQYFIQAAGPKEQVSSDESTRFLESFTLDG
jgi:hypothetical protein